MAKNTKSETTTAKNLPKEQLDLPVSFDASGKMVLLREYRLPSLPTLSLAQLSSEQQTELTVRRIEMQPKFELGSLGAGTISKERAIAEVKNQSPLGKNLVEIEMRVIQTVTDEARKNHA